MHILVESRHRPGHLYQPNAKLASHFGRNYRLSSWAAESTLDTVQRKARMSHPAHQHLDLVGGKGNGSAYCLFNVLNPIIKLVIDGSANKPSSSRRTRGDKGQFTHFS